MSSDAHNVVENTGQFTKQNSDVFGSQRDVDIEEFLHGQTRNKVKLTKAREDNLPTDLPVGLLVTHHAHIVQPVKVGQGLRNKELQSSGGERGLRSTCRYVLYSMSFSVPRCRRPI